MIQKRKNGLLFFLISLVPGAAEMYMGFMKQGLGLLGALFLSIYLASYFAFPFAFLIPIVWLYSFFHAHNLRGMEDEEFYAVEDKFFFEREGLKVDSVVVNNNVRKVIAVILILMGFSVFYRQLMNWMSNFLPYEWYFVTQSVFNTIPQLLIAIALVWVGVWLIRGKKRQLDREAVVGTVEPAEPKAIELKKEAGEEA